VSTVLCAFSKTSHVEENIKSVEMARKFTKEINEQIEKILGNKPKQHLDWKGMKPRPDRR